MVGNGLDEKGETFIMLLQKLKEKKHRDEEQHPKNIVKKLESDGLGNDANKPMDDFEEAGWTRVTSKRQRRRR